MNTRTGIALLLVLASIALAAYGVRTIAQHRNATNELE